MTAIVVSTGSITTITTTSKCETINAWCLLLSSTGTRMLLVMTLKKNQHFRVRFGVGGRGSIKSVLSVRFHKCR